MLSLLQGLPRGVGQEEAHQAATGEEHGHDEGRRGAVGVKQRRDHYIADDAAEASGHHGHSYTRRTGNYHGRMKY